jgi:ribonuclease Z
VKLLALTHVSPRYSGGELRDEARAVFGNTIVPRDFDVVEIPLPERGPPIHHREALGSAGQQPL